MKTSLWQEHFKDSVKGAEKLYSSDATEVSFLLFCLRSKLISSQEYMEWAKTAYQRPVLNENFFLSYPPQSPVYQKHQKEYHWGVECLPLCEWDGVLIVGCLEVPEDFQPQQPTVFILTAHENLEKLWGLYQKAITPVSTDLTDMNALAATMVVSKMNSSDIEGLLVDGVGDELNETLQEVAQEEISEPDSGEAAIPDGLLGEATVVDLSPTAAKIKTPDPDATQATRVTLSIDDATELLPESASAKTVIASLNDFKEPQPIVMKATVVPAAPKPSPPPTAGNIKRGPRSVEPIITSDIKIAKNEYKPPAPVFEDSAIIAPAPDVAAIAAMDVPKAPLKPAQAPGLSAAYFLEKVRRQNQAVFDKEIENIFNQMKFNFSHCLLLAVGDKDRLLKPVAWDSGVPAARAKVHEFNLKKPSIFRTATGTQKPYHGYVVANDVNDSFFDSWNLGKLPDHVTLVPVMDGENVVGLLMGMGEKSCYNKNVLQFTEKMSKEISHKLLKSGMNRAA